MYNDEKAGAFRAAYTFFFVVYVLVTMLKLNCDSKGVNRVYISMLPMICLKIETTERCADVTFVLDTGCSVSNVSLDLIKKLNITHRIMRDEATPIQGVTGQCTTVGSINLLTKIPNTDVSRYINYQIMDNNLCLFGSDVLISQKASIDYGSMQLTLCGVTVPMRLQAEPKHDHRVDTMLCAKDSDTVNLIMKNIRDHPADYKYQSVSLECKRIRELSDAGWAVLLDNGFVQCDNRLVYVV